MGRVQARSPSISIVQILLVSTALWRSATATTTATSAAAATGTALSCRLGRASLGRAFSTVEVGLFFALFIAFLEVFFVFGSLLVRQLCLLSRTLTSVTIRSLRDRVRQSQLGALFPQNGLA
jgi:hypothetical protein